MMRADPHRNAEIAKIHIAKKQLRLDDDSYRLLLQRVTRKASAGQMSSAERRAVLRELERLGWKLRPAAEAKAEKLAGDEVARKIRACWLDLRDAGMLTDSSERALLHFVKRMTRRERLEWLSPRDANLVIEALKRWHERGSASGSQAGN